MELRRKRSDGSDATITGYACACPTPDAPTRPAIVLDPFCGTGTTVGVARALGRVGIGVDLSADYCRLAQWRVFESDHFQKVLKRTTEDRQGTLL
jgi:23S rRNA G2445 N2-methylase RlmL